MGDADRGKPEVACDLGDEAFVNRIAVPVEEADGERVDIAIANLLEFAANFNRVRWPKHITAGRQPLGDFHDLGIERPWFAHNQIEEFRAVLVTDLQHVGKAGRRHQSTGSSVARQQAIGASSRPQTHFHFWKAVLQCQSERPTDGEDGGFFRRDKTVRRALPSGQKDRVGELKSPAVRVETGDTGQRAIGESDGIVVPELARITLTARIHECGRIENPFQRTGRFRRTENFALVEPACGIAREAIGEGAADIDGESPEGSHGGELVLIPLSVSTKLE